MSSPLPVQSANAHRDDRTNSFRNDPPDDVVIGPAGECLDVVWADIGRVSLDASSLWQNCPSALARRRRLDGADNRPVAGLSIAFIQPIGHYAINIGFSDGHDRGVFPWALLRTLSSRPRLQDFLIVDASEEAGEATEAGGRHYNSNDKGVV